MDEFMMCHSFGILQAPRNTLQDTINRDNKYCRSEDTNEAPREPLALRALHTQTLHHFLASQELKPQLSAHKAFY